MKLVALIALFASAVVAYENGLVNDKNVINRINSDSSSTWKAHADPRFDGLTVAEARKMFGLKMLTKEESRQVAYEMPAPWDETEMIPDEAVPSSFDSRLKWPKFIGAIRNQEQCGSCWSFSSAEVLSDRFAIQSNGQVMPDISAQDAVSCDTQNMGCNGGELSLVWEYLKTTGAVTSSCMPYTAGNGTVAPCPSTCVNGAPFKKYKASKTYQVAGWWPVGRVEKIKKEIMTHGPVQTGFEVYSDFMNYKSGVYQHTTGDLLGGHAVKIIGWGEENSTPYWLVANSWGYTWPANSTGTDRGVFKIVQGKDECGFEKDVYAGLADLN